MHKIKYKLPEHVTYVRKTIRYNFHTYTDCILKQFGKSFQLKEGYELDGNSKIYYFPELVICEQNSILM